MTGWDSLSGAQETRIAGGGLLAHTLIDAEVVAHGRGGPARGRDDGNLGFRPARLNEVAHDPCTGLALILDTHDIARPNRAELHAIGEIICGAIGQLDDACPCV